MAVTEAKIEKAHTLLAAVLEHMSPEEQEGFFNKNGNPLYPVPPDEAKIDEFIRKLGPLLLGEKTQEEISKEIDRLMLRSLVETYKKEAVKGARVGASAQRRSKADVRELMRHAIEAPFPVEEKGPLFEVLVDKSDREPEKTTREIISEGDEVIAVKLAAAPVPNEAKSEVFKFQNLKNLNVTQKVMAPLADVFTSVFPGARAGAINGILADSLDKIIKNTDKITKVFGSNAVNEPWFKKLQSDSQNLMTQGSRQGGAKTVVDDVLMSLFRGAPDPTVIAYIELVRISYMQGVAPPSFSQMRAASMGWGSVLRMGFNFGVSSAEGAVVSRGLAAFGVKLLAGPEGWILAAIQLAGGFLGKLGGWFKGLAGFKGGFSKQDWWVLAFVCVPILILFIFYTEIQSDTDMALVQNLAGGGSGQIDTNPYLDVSITGAPETLSGNTPTAMRYTVSVKPKGSPGSFKINSAAVSFSVYGGPGCPDLVAPPITPDMLSGENYSFVVPFCAGLQNSVVTATLNANADVGSSAGVTGSDSFSTVVGSPSTGCFVFGGAGQHDNYGFVSSAWDNTGPVTAAIGVLSKSQAYMAKICNKNDSPSPITIYRVKADFGGGTTTPPDSIFMYNACAATSCATYTLAHETGHVLAARTGLFGDYTGLGLPDREGYLWTYPNDLTPGEDFAETMGAYVAWHNYTWGARHGHPAGNLDYTGKYPIHYNFAKSVFGGVEY